MKTDSCYLCKEEKSTEKTQIRIKLNHQTIIPLYMTHNVCKKCKKDLNTGIQRTTKARLTL